jgi:cytochrome b
MIYVWDRFVRLAHWLLVAAFAVAFYTHNSEWYRDIHVMAGYTVGTLLVLRIIWGFIGSGYARFSAFPPDIGAGLRYVRQIFSGHADYHIGHNPAGTLVIYAMLGVGLVCIASGLLVYNEGELPEMPFDPGDIHQYASWTWLILVVSHICGVILESLLHKENLILTMITGYKKP